MGRSAPAHGASRYAGCVEPGMDEPMEEILRRDGYVKVPGCVGRSSVDRALTRINAWIGRDMTAERRDEYTHRSACPDDRNHPDFMALWSPVRPHLDRLLGVGAHRRPERAQIALRFPDPVRWDAHPHLDGMSHPLNGVRPGTISNFAALLGIYLSDVPSADAGNLTVWPGSHRLLAAHFARHGPRSLLRGMPELELGPARPLIGAAGDVFICHYLLAHGAACNVSPHIRYAAYFRIRSTRHDALGLEPMSDPWLGWAL